MKTVDLAKDSLSLAKLTELAQRDPVLVRRKDGNRFLMTHADEFETEVELLRRNHEFLAFLDQRFKSTKRIPIEELEARIGRKRRPANDQWRNSIVRKIPEKIVK
jgi:PHD/YefM family antitoxin component YafN of YafNO toxin-antitoxin module